ncbi:hypothetical protein [Enterococcus faecalis]|uniref:hypothetical protein n=1 Tax=Enterococcus faecalis TaxID=1351 RepID=UPI003CC5AF88
MWEFLDKFNSVIGVGMFIVTGINLFISWKINERINSAVDLHRLKLSKDEEIGQINAFIRIINNKKNLSFDDKENLKFFLSGLKGRYPDIKKLNQKQLIRKLNCKKCNYSNIVELLELLKTQIERRT